MLTGWQGLEFRYPYLIKRTMGEFIASLSGLSDDFQIR